MIVVSSLRICLLCCLGVLAVLPARAADDVSAVTLHVRENATAGAPIGAVGSAGGMCRYSIVTGNQEAAFAIDARSGRLTVDNAAALDHERRDRFDLILLAERPSADDSARRAFLSDVLDSGAPLHVVEQLLTDTEEIRVTVLVDDVAERPVLPEQTVTVTPWGSEAADGARIDARDEDRNDTLRFEILGGAPAELFDIDTDSGRLRIDQAVPLPPGVHEYPLTVQVTDSSGQSDATTITVRAIVLPAGPAPLLVASPPVSTSEAAEPPPPVTDPKEGSENAGGESIVSTPPTVPVADDVESHADAATPLAVDENEDPAVHASGGRLLARVVGVFLLLALAVAAVVWWLKRRALRKALAEDERLRRLQLISDEAADHETESATGESDIEESVTQELRGLQQLLTEQSQPQPVTSEHQNSEGEPVTALAETPAHEEGQTGLAFSMGLLDAAAPNDLDRAAADEQNEHDELYEVSEESYEFEPDEDEDESNLDASRESDETDAPADPGRLFEWNENEARPLSHELFESVDEEALQDADEQWSAIQQWASELSQNPAELAEGRHEVDGDLWQNDDSEEAGADPAGTTADGQFDDFALASTEPALLEVLHDEGQIADGLSSPPDVREAVDEPIETHEARWDEPDATFGVGEEPEESAGHEAPQLPGWIDSDPQTAAAPVPTDTRNDELPQTELEEPSPHPFSPPATGHSGDEPNLEEGRFFEPVKDDSQLQAAASVEEWTQDGAAAAVPGAEPVGATTDGRIEEKETAPEQQGLMEILHEGSPFHAGEANEDAADIYGCSEAADPQSDFVPTTDAEGLEKGIVAGENQDTRETAADEHSDEFPHLEPLPEAREHGTWRPAPDPALGAPDPEDALLDARVRRLREQIAQKLGIGAGDSSGDSDPPPTEPVSDSSAVGFESIGASFDSGERPDAPVEDPPGDELSLEDVQDDEAWGGGLSTARFLLQQVSEASPVVSEPISEEVAPPLPEEVAEPVKVKRRNKSEIRRELSSLREVAIRHARSRMAQEAPRQQMRRTWYVSAWIMVALNVAAMGVMSVGPTGMLKLVGWTLMLAGACALAVCLHSFSQMDADDGLPHSPATDEAQQSQVPDSGS